MDNRILELAIENLTRQRAELDAEIQSLRAQMGKKKGAGAPKSAPKKRHKRSLAARKAQSAKMKAYWAKRKSKSSRKRK